MPREMKENLNIWRGISCLWMEENEGREYKEQYDRWRPNQIDNHIKMNISGPNKPIKGKDY